MQLNIAEDSLEQIIKQRLNNKEEVLNTCRICLEEQYYTIGLQDDFKLITPCHCLGSVAYIHNKCLKSWIEKQLNAQPQKRIHCQICKTQIYFRTNILKECEINKFNCLKISVSKMISLCIQLTTIIILTVLYCYSPTLSSQQYVSFVILIFLGLITCTIIYTIYLILKLACQKTTRKIEKIYSLHEVERKKMKDLKERSQLTGQCLMLNNQALMKYQSNNFVELQPKRVFIIGQRFN